MMCWKEEILSAEIQDILYTKTKKDKIMANHEILLNLDLRFGIIKYNPNNVSFVVIDKNRKLLYDFSIGNTNKDA